MDLWVADDTDEAVWPDATNWFKGAQPGKPLGVTCSMGRGFSSNDRDEWERKDKFRCLLLFGGWQWFNEKAGDNIRELEFTGALRFVMLNAPLQLTVHHDGERVWLPTQDSLGIGGGTDGWYLSYDVLKSECAKISPRL
jgi:hypothetical protein